MSESWEFQILRQDNCWRICIQSKGPKRKLVEFSLKIHLHVHIYRVFFFQLRTCVHGRFRNPFTPFWIQVMFSVFRGHKYDDIRPNHTKKIQKCPKNGQKTQKLKIALHCTAVHGSETPQLLTPDGSNMTHNDPGWLTMAQDDIPGVRGGTRGPREAPGGTRGHRLLLRPKKVIKQ